MGTLWEVGSLQWTEYRGGRVQVPHNVWLVWLPQLLTSLQRPEAPHVKRILVDLARLFPQVPLPDYPCTLPCLQAYVPWKLECST